MQVVKGIENITKVHQNCVVTLGFFDGLHIGHKAILAEAIKMRNILQSSIMVFTFDRHPDELICPDKSPPLITTLAEKKAILQGSGVDILLVAEFDTPFSRFSPHNFVTSILYRKLMARGVVAGYNYKFGFHKKGNANFLKQEGERYNFQVKIVQPVYVNKTLVSSSLVRQRISEGKVDSVERYLGRWYSLSGTVTRDEGRGNIVGFPTANIAFATQKIIPKEGVYAGIVKFNEKKFWGAVNIGKRPTFDGQQLVIEVHILDFKGDLYGQEIEIAFIKRLRDEQKFASSAQLATQIKKDIQKIRKILYSLPHTRTTFDYLNLTAVSY